jgi:two-component system sensor histidine kinase KdpD
MPWYAIYVDTRKPDALTDQAQNRVWGVLQLAESLGATTHILNGPSPADVVLNYIRKHAITQIVIGNSQQPVWRRMLGLTLVDRLLRRANNVDFLIVNHGEVTEPVFSRPLAQKRKIAWKAYVAALGLVGIATLIGLPARGLIVPSVFITTYLLSLVIAAVYLGFGMAVLTAVGSVLAFDFFYLPPYYSLALSDWSNLLPLIGFLVVSGVISTLVRHSRQQTDTVRQREAHTHALYQLSRDLAKGTDMSTILDVIVEHWQQIFGGEVAVTVRDESGQIDIGARSANFDVTWETAHMALQTYEQGLSADLEELDSPEGPQATSRITLKTAQSIVGVLITQRDEDEESPATPEQERVIAAFANQAASAIERVQFAQQAQEAKTLKMIEALQTALLNSVSHDLRSPLSSITGVLSTLHEEAYLLDKQTQHELVSTALGEAQRLNHLVRNLLDMSRIEANALRLTRDLNEVQDLIGTVLIDLEQRLEHRPIEVDVPRSLPLIPMDFVLMSRVLHNLIENADKYAPEGSPLEVQAKLNEPWLEISVTDHGPGVSPKDLERIFDKFYRSSRTRAARGTGLGLAISRGIVKAHGGRIWAENCDTGGLQVTVAIPASERQQRDNKLTEGGSTDGGN